MENEPYEIERKFLIRRPDEAWLAARAESSEIVQTYLLAPEEGGRARVRMRSFGDRVVYTYTVKHRVNDLRAVEREREISCEEYTRLLELADPKRKTLRKRRFCLPYRKQLFEIDLYPFWADQAIMEIELSNEEQGIELPPEIELICEVSSDRRYSNASLAKMLAFEEGEATLLKG